MENNGLLNSLLNNTNVNFTVSIDDKSIIHLAIALLIVVCMGLLLWGIARKYS